MANTDLNPQGGIQGSSQIYNFGTSPNTRSVVTQKVRVLAPAYGGSGLFQIGVTRMRCIAQCINHEDIRTFQKPQAFIGKGMKVVTVCKIANAKTKAADIPMILLDRQQADVRPTPRDRKGIARLDQGLLIKNGRIAALPFEAILEACVQGLRCRGIKIGRNRLPHH